MVKNVDPHNWKSTTTNRWYRPNYLKALNFRNPDWIPCSMSIYQGVWARYREKLKAIAVRHPFIFGSLIKFRRSFGTPIEQQPHNVYTVNNWGEGSMQPNPGYGGIVVTHPLENWDALATYKFPDPNKLMASRKRNWPAEKIGMRIAHRFGFLTMGSGESLFDRLYYLRGFDNLMRDIATNNPHLLELIQRFTDHEIFIAKKYIEIGKAVDIVYFHTDIGMQDRLMISPKKFRQYIKPMYSAIFQPLRKANIHVNLSSDGRLLDIVDDLVECGVSIHDPQLRANTLEGIQKCLQR